ncbi:MAG: hypothetical protein ACKOU7_07335 [Ferruginibacter sp.]
MDFKKICFPFILFGFLVFFTACSEKDKVNIENTYYVELVNFTKDSLQKKLSEGIFGKVSFYKDRKLNILSVNYVIDIFPDMHFFKPVSLLDKNIEENTRKIKVELKDSYSADSISYSLQKYRYTNGAWKKYSDMGFIKAVNSDKDSRQYAIDEYSTQIIKNLVEYTYN